MPLLDVYLILADAAFKALAPFLPFFAAGLLVSLWACHRPRRAKRRRKLQPHELAAAQGFPAGGPKPPYRRRPSKPYGWPLNGGMDQ